MEAPPVTVEVHLANGLPNFTIVGLPEVEVKESKDRVRSALLNCRFEFPARRITVNLAPADLPKESGRFDLPIALGILAASAQIPAKRLGEYEFAGELALTGELRPINGALAMTYNAPRSGRAFVLSVESASVRERVSAARDIQLQRQGTPNALMSVMEIESHCVAEPQGQQLARQAITRLGLSARAYHRILKVARTIADLAGAATVSAAEVAEAVQYRRRPEKIHG
jgi:predicted ATPase with chaperone activity